ncbi:U32 family peptidase [Herbaspirillum sp. RV1423]|uniref:ubiquinone anaerobic biosynthesis protein UbiV n=1 Tax=Herbaspirillum sp. RV1423 TaxID=1443993 RepID=UPI0004B2A37B|nr:U32 family peptidase [Herbaspirillum sp. RV1423]
MLKLALGPILYYWPRDTVFAFYDKIAATPVDIVYIGETVCSRRHELRPSEWLQVAETLTAAGKQVVLSTQVLLESGSDLSTMRRITDNGRFMVEANDMGAVSCLTGKGAFVAGPHLNIYNPPTLELMASLGASRWVMPLEMDANSLAIMQETRPAGLETEVFAYGRMALAFSARCFTARHRNLEKDHCQFSCIAHPDGLTLKTKEGLPFLVLNGIQTQSSLVYNLLGQVKQMQALGVDILRVSPQSAHTEEIIGAFDSVRTERVAAEEAAAAMQQWMPEESCNGYWFGQPGQSLNTDRSYA